MTILPAISRLLARARQLPDLDPLAVLPLLTVVLLLLHAPEVWYLRIPLVVLAVVGLALARLLHSTGYWFATATILGATVYFHWDSADNHQYLFVYWCLALCAAFSLPRDDQAPALALSSRWLLGLCMLLATVWKMAMPDYRDGSFFEFTLLADHRFGDLARLAAGVPSMTLADNRELTSLMTEGHLRGMTVDAARLGGTPRVGLIAELLTWWTVAIEGLLALLFLLPDRPATRWLRNGSLILFAATTYSVAHVRGFGWMLMLLGFAQCRPEEKGWRYAYLGAFLLIQLYFVPIVAIVELLLDALGLDAGCGC